MPIIDYCIKTKITADLLFISPPKGREEEIMREQMASSVDILARKLESVIEQVIHDEIKRKGEP